MKKNIFYTFFAVANVFFWNDFSLKTIFAQNSAPELPIPKGSINVFPNASSQDDKVIMVLELIQSVLLTIVLPVVAVGMGIYVAYILLTAEGDEGKMKQAWKAVVYSAVGMLVIAFSAFVVKLIASLQISSF